jgi:hypothetical protein
VGGDRLGGDRRGVRVTEHDIAALGVLFREFCDEEPARSRELAIARSYFEQTLYFLRLHNEKQIALEGAQEA